MAKSKLNIVVIGGGTGTSVVLEGLKKYPVNLSAIVTTADDGGSGGALRKEFKMIPPGDVRQCLIALASGNFGYLNQRFQEGFLQGHTLGNLLITSFYQKNRDFQKAVDELLGLVGAQGSILPMTLRPVTLIAELCDGRILRGEKNVTVSGELKEKLDKLMLLPKNVSANPHAIEAIERANVIVVGPGNLYSSIIPNFLVKGIRDAVRKSKAKKIYVANLFTQPGHTNNFSVEDFIGVLGEYIGDDVFTDIIYNNRPFPESLVKKNKSFIVGSQVRAINTMRKDKRFIGRSIASMATKFQSPSDSMGQFRNPFLHDSKKLARVIMSLL